MAHSFDTKVRFAGTGNPLTQAYTCGAGVTLLVVTIMVYGSTRRTPGTPTYDSVAMTKVWGEPSNASECICEMWYLTNPITGSEKTVSIPNAGGQTLKVVASSYKAQSSYTSRFDVGIGTYSNSGANPSLALTPTVAGDVIVAVCGGGSATPPSDRTHTVLYETDNGAYSDNHQYALVADTSETTVGWTIGTDNYSILLGAFKEVDADAPFLIVQASADTQIYEYAPTTNYGTATTFYVSPYNGRRRHALLSFDLSAIPSGATIDSAVLSLYAEQATSSRTIGCYRLRRTDWVEAQATWNIYKTGSDWGTAGALNTSTDHDTTDGASYVTNSLSIPSWYDFVVTAQAQYALDNVVGVAHFLLRDTGAALSVNNIFESREYTTDPTLCPKLVIYYTEAAASGPAALKTVNGLVKASVKTRQGLVIASVKTWDGLA